MATADLQETLQAKGDVLPGELDGDAIDRILTEPQQNTLAEALAADAVDAAPLIGDLLAISRMQTAEERGIEYPERPTSVENVLSDIPAPLDTIGDILVSQNTLQHLGVDDEVAGVKTPTAIADEAAAGLDEQIESLTPGGGGGT